PAGSGTGKLTFDIQNQGYTVQFSSPSLQLEKLAAVTPGKLQVAGVVGVSFAGRGTVKDPQLAATIEAPKLIIEQQTLAGLKLRADVAHQKAVITLDTA